MNDLILITLLLTAGGFALYFSLKGSGPCSGCKGDCAGGCPKCRKRK